MSIATIISETPAKVVATLKVLGEIPDHIQALGVIAGGAVIKLVHPHESTGDALIAAGLGMWKGKQ
jgi:hypothetical protein